MSYRISTVAEMTGIPRNTLIAWERRYGILNPERRDNGYRRYTESDVAQVFKLKSAMDSGLKISEAVELLRSGQPNDSDLRPFAGSSPAATEPLDGFAQLRRELFAALSQYQANRAQELLSTLLTTPFPTRLHQIYFPVLRDFGDAWARGEISIAQEHFATGIIKAHLATIFIGLGQSASTAPHAASTTLPHDEHEIAALAMAIHLSLSGHRVSYLGAKLPLHDLSEFCDTQKPKLVCISCITLPEEEEFQQYLEQLPDIAEKGVRIALGGAALAGRTARGPVEMFSSWNDFKV